MLSEEQLQHYYREGYIVVPGLIGQDSIRLVLEAAMEIVPPGGVGSDRWKSVIHDHLNPVKDARLHRLLVEPRLIEAITDIFNMPPLVYYGMLAVVAAGGGHGLPWHQDNQYNQVLPSALNAFIALSDITPGKANLWVAPRSHRLGTQPSKRNETTAPGHREAIVEPENGIPLPAMQSGDVCIFDRNTYHRSVRNETDEDRYAYAAQYAAANARRAESGEKEPKWRLASELALIWRDNGALER